MSRPAAGRASLVFRRAFRRAFRRGIGNAILVAALAVPAAAVGAELGQPAPGSTIKRISPPQSGSDRIGGLEGFQGHSTAPGKAGAIGYQAQRFRRIVTQGPNGAELRVITLGSPANTLAGVPPVPRPRPARESEFEMVSLASGPASPGLTRLRPGMRPLGWPLTGVLVSSGYGLRRHPILGGRRPHAGVDLPAPSGTPVRAAADGVVRYFGRNGSYGRFIRLDHGFGLETAYGHLRRYALSLRRNGRVRRGEVIGYVGSSGLSTGPHLHYEVRINGRA
ncbi:MAG: M23 family metallopeptidase, partial [Alphaproteobacteria bacterium]|nr:M23 family metallopeptidase [Alphaproteobacteria bacterium]